MPTTPIALRRRPRRVLPGLALLAIGLVAACAAPAPSTPPSATAPAAVAPAAAVATAQPRVPTTAPVKLTPIPLPVATPAPYGPAGNGRLLYVADGVLTWFDTESGATGAIAESGSLIIDDFKTTHRLAALSPWVHVGVLKKSEIHRNFCCFSCGFPMTQFYEIFLTSKDNP